MPNFRVSITHKLFRRRKTTLAPNEDPDGEPPGPSIPDGPPHLPRELAEEICNHLWNDKYTLCTLGLVSQEFHRWSRFHLFTVVKFNLNQRFDSFLDLLGSSPTTFASVIKVLHLVALFSPRGVCRERTEAHMGSLTQRLPNLKTIWLTSISWSSIPPHILSFFSALEITHLQLESVIFYRPDQPKELFQWIPENLQSITFDTVQFDGQRVEDSPAFQRSLCFRALDSTSLAIFKDVWAPNRSKGLDITVQTLHIQLSVLLWPNRKEKALSFIHDFLTHIGPSIRRLSIDLSSPASQRDVLEIYEALDFSTCTKLDMIHIGVIELDEDEKVTRVTSTMWKILSSLPSPEEVDYIELTFTPKRKPMEADAAALEGFPWLQSIQRLQEMFLSLKKITIRIGAWHLAGKESCFSLEEIGLTNFEDAGIVKLEMYRWPQSFDVEMPFYRLPWKGPMKLS